MNKKSTAQYKIKVGKIYYAPANDRYYYAISKDANHYITWIRWQSAGLLKPLIGRWEPSAKLLITLSENTTAFEIRRCIRAIFSKKGLV